MSGKPAPRTARISDWIAVDPDGVIVLHTGKVELGQGAVTAIVQMGCHELGVPVSTVRWTSGDTRRGPDEWYTAGSVSIELGGLAMRRACAQAREIALQRAAAVHGRPRGGLDIVDGRLCAGGVPQGMDGAALWLGLDLGVVVDDQVPLRTGPGLLGVSVPRLDLRDKLRGSGFIHDRRPAGLLVGRVLRAPNHASRLLSVDASALRALPGVLEVVVDGSFVGFVATSESEAWAAADAARALCRWDVAAVYPDVSGVQALMTGLPVETRLVLRDGDAPPDAGAAADLTAVYSRPAIAHASIGPACALATCIDGQFEVVSHSQGVFALRGALATALRVDVSAVHVTHAAGAGCYGHNGADDAALDACLLARAVPGRPVKVTWSRADELTASPVGSPMMVRISASLAAGRIGAWRLEVWSGLHGARPGWNGAVNLLAAAQLADPIAAADSQDVAPELGGGGDRNACAAYILPQHEVLYHFVPGMPLRTSSLRALGSYVNLFAIESCIDELALLAGADALQFRLDHLADPRAREVLQRVALAAGWAGGATARDNAHQGIAFGRYKNKAAYIAVVAQLTIGDDFQVERVWACVDAGLAVNPDGLRNQVEGGLIQSLSWTLLEQVRFSTTHIDSDSWERYPILPFSATPQVHVEILDRPELPPLGVGEVAQGPMAAAVANALARGLGLRVRDLPLSREHILAAMA